MLRSGGTKLQMGPGQKRNRNSTRHNVTFSRLDKDGDQWKTPQSFARDHLLLVKLYVENAAQVRMTDTGTEFGLARRRPFIVRMPNGVGS